MKAVLRWLNLLSGRQDIVLAVMLMVAVFMMILPLPTVLIDLLIAVNLTFSIILLMLAIYLREPLEFSSFPAVLLITTLYRLSLTISTTRLILLHQDAGEIVYTFGNFVVGGNLAVGLIIFSIITIVQFMVITKGSERVAEVGARFSLDGMPGKQMSIDGDMRAGIIDAREAKRQRLLVQKESQLFGAMDGAMKFVKGDAVAGIIVILVNIFGGIAIGVFQRGMAAGEAMNLYAILSVGDGLIGQIPALLISITAGIIVTRVPGEVPQNLAADLAQQIGRQPQPLWVAGSVLLLFAVLPGFPTLIFLLLALLLGGAGYQLKRTASTSGKGGSETAAAEGTGELTPGSLPLILSLSPELATTALDEAVIQLRWQLFERLGISLPDIEIQKKQVTPGQITILLYQEPVCSVLLPSHQALLESPEAPPSEAHEVAEIPLGSAGLYWVAESLVPTLQHSGLVVYPAEARIIYTLRRAVTRYAKEFIGIQETRFLMDAMETRYGELVKELQRQVPLGRIADILQRLVEEGISIRDLRTIFESLIVWGSKEKDVVILAEYVRVALRRHIIGHYRNEQGEISVWLIGHTIENQIRESIRQTSAGSYSALEPPTATAILTQIKQALGAKKSGVLLTAIDVRRYLRKIVERELFDLQVLSYQELGDEVALQVLGNIEQLDNP
ncbi:EscV/YscV/HrcV family type III secretion system export apparatus protein [unidentified bacterial endosymbiont]|uniref:EscV/YscV/HrcV family type III secretion system export apparatus protein n=1 Tax=unidentified bacterial endosymbiont TaxID=2355 RepID=UPI0020A1F3BF|nr:EscV/YscV/HrcV family type III secretion system export apparatus protein [unidentified bacterial endosymbiont]